MSVTTYHHAGRTIRRRTGLAGQLQFDVTGSEHEFTLIGSAYGTPGPVTILIGTMQDHVAAPHRFGDEFNIAYVRKWIDDENAAAVKIADALRSPEPIDVVCPACNARPGKPCTAPTDTSRRPVGWVHASRTDAVSS